MSSVPLRAHCGVIGEAEVGKSALLKAFEKKHYFQQQYVMTQGAQLFVQVVHLDDGRQGERQTEPLSPKQNDAQHEHAVELYLTEVGGHALFAPMKDRYLAECPYVLACFDTTRRSTLDAVLERYKSYKQHLTPPASPQLALLVGCKSDRRADAEVTSDEGEEQASEAGLAGYVECSAATGDGVEELFERVARHVAEQHDSHSADRHDRHGAGQQEEDGEDGASPHQRTRTKAQPKQSRELSADDSDDD